MRRGLTLRLIYVVVSTWVGQSKAQGPVKPISTVDSTFPENDLSACVIDQKTTVLVYGTVWLQDVNTDHWKIGQFLIDGNVVCTISDITDCPPVDPKKCNCHNRTRNPDFKEAVVMKILAQKAFSQKSISYKSSYTLGKTKLFDTSISTIRFPYVSGSPPFLEVSYYGDTVTTKSENVSLPDDVVTVKVEVKAIETPFTFGSSVNGAPYRYNGRNVPVIEMDLVSTADIVCIRYREHAYCMRSKTICLVRGLMPIHEACVPCDEEETYPYVLALLFVVQSILFLGCLACYCTEACKESGPVSIFIVMTLVFIAGLIIFSYEEISRCGLGNCSYILLGLMAVSFVSVMFIIQIYFKDRFGVLMDKCVHVMLSIAAIMSTSSLMACLVVLIIGFVRDGSYINPLMSILMVLVFLLTLLGGIFFIKRLTAEPKPKGDEDVGEELRYVDEFGGEEYETEDYYPQTQEELEEIRKKRRATAVSTML